MINKEIAWDNIKVFIDGKEITGITAINYELDKKNIGLMKKEYLLPFLIPSKPMASRPFTEPE